MPSSSISTSSVHPSLPTSLLESFKSDPIISEYPSLIYTDQFERFRVKALSHRVSCEAEVIKSQEPGLASFVGGAVFENIDLFSKGDNRTFLHLAAREGDVPLAYECIRMGLTIDSLDRRGSTALFLGCEMLRALEAVKAQLKRTSIRPPSGSDIAKALSDENIDKCFERTLRVAELLIEQHADVNMGVHEDTPLIIAAKISCWRLVELLLKHGARVPTALSLNSPSQTARFKQLVRTVKPVSPRPARPCPCWSQKLLSDCHAAQSHPYPADFLCKCGTKKTYGQCCAKKKFSLQEEWDPQDKWIMSSQSRYMNLPTNAIESDEFSEGMRRMQELAFQGLRSNTQDRESFREELNKGKEEMINTVVGHRPDVDAAFKYASKKADFFARTWQGQLSKIECKKRMDEWNGAVDEYIASGIDLRPKFEIELGAKIGMSGGPFYKHCEATGCKRVEGREVERMKCCSSCKRIYYCGQSCQTVHWKTHKHDCKRGNHPEQQLRSQLIMEEQLLETTKMFAQMFPQSQSSVSPLQQEEFD